MRMQIWVLIAVWVLAGCALGTPGSAPEIDIDITDNPPTETMTLQERCESKEGFVWEGSTGICRYTQEGNPIINIEYPVMIAHEPMIERTMDSYVTILREQFVTDFEINGAQSPGAFQLIVEPIIYLRDDSIISVRWDETRYVGGANISFEYTTFVFDLNQADLLRFSDLFTDDTDVLTTIQPLVRDSLTTQIGDTTTQDAIIRGTDELVEFDHFVLTDTDLLIFFEPYTVGAGALGAQTIRLSLDSAPNLREVYR
ncbi:MAG: RsiV family protein [Chloroflexota bacterium]